MTNLVHGPLILVFLLALTVIANAADPKPLLPVGSFSSIKQDGEHCSGYSVDLWSVGDQSTQGVFKTCAGLTGDIKSAALEKASYDTKSGEIKFEANLSLGTDYLKGGKEALSQDHFIYHGKVQGDTLTGAIVRENKNRPNRKPLNSSVSMKRTKTVLKTFGSVEDWRAWIKSNQRAP